MNVQWKGLVYGISKNNHKKVGVIEVTSFSVVGVISVEFHGLTYRLVGQFLVEYDLLDKTCTIDGHLPLQSTFYFHI
jgi:hypothetical protein